VMQSVVVPVLGDILVRAVEPWKSSRFYIYIIWIANNLSVNEKHVLLETQF
jgi:hypothetical protein